MIGIISREINAYFENIYAEWRQFFYFSIFIHLFSLLPPSPGSTERDKTGHRSR